MTEESRPPEYARTIFIVALPSCQSIIGWKPMPHQLIAETDFNVARGLDHFAIRRDKAQAIDGLGDGHVAHLVVLVTNHGTEMTFVSQLDRFDAEARAED